MIELDPIIAAIADPTRRQVIEMLSDGREMTMTDVAQNFDMSRQAIAKHLGILRDAGVVVSEKRGRERIHVLAPDQMNLLTEWVNHYSRFWDKRLAKLKDLIEEDHNRDRHKTTN